MREITVNFKIIITLLSSELFNGNFRGSKLFKSIAKYLKPEILEYFTGRQKICIPGKFIAESGSCFSTH